jgi:hypothetical protein
MEKVGGQGSDLEEEMLIDGRDQRTIKRSQMGLVRQSQASFFAESQDPHVMCMETFTIAISVVSCPRATLSSSPKCSQVDQEASTVHLTSF